MVLAGKNREFSGWAKVWQELESGMDSANDVESLDSEVILAEEFRDEYIRLPYDENPAARECCW